MPEMSKHHFDPILVTSQGSKRNAVFVVTRRVCNYWPAGERQGLKAVYRVLDGWMDGWMPDSSTEFFALEMLLYHYRAEYVRTRGTLR